MTNITTIPEKAQLASYVVALRIAKCKKPHTIGEELLLPAAMDMCRVMVGEEAANKLKNIPLSNDTVGRRISEMSSDVKSQLVERLRSCEQFAVQLDECTDVSSAAQLLVYVRYAWGESILEDILFCKEVEGRATGEEIFKILDKFMTEEHLSWEKCVAVCTDGAAAMTGYKSGVVSRIQAVNPKIAATHCMLHRLALSSKSLVPELRDVLDVVVAAVNFVKSRPLKSRLFAKLCTETGATHEKLLFHSEVRWLSRGKVIERVFELKDELRAFLTEHKPELAQYFSDPEWIARLAYLSDIFNLLNGLNLSNQGAYSTILEVSDKINGFMRKAELWKRKLQTGVTDMFPNLTDFLDTNTLAVDFMRDELATHLASLADNFSRYFKDVNIEKYDWVRDPFSCDVMASGLFGKAEDELLELSSDRTLKMKFKQQTPAEFWPIIGNEYKEVTLQAMRILLPFPTTYLCETSFSTMMAIKTKYRARLDVEDDLRVCLSPITPRIEKLCSERQAHPSH
ncbi:zinc finger BED domain-containing protein 5-like [Astyanax mexicanus]|uniref:Zinc finger BED domain-containing protein 5-like n=1 Tax=Astyanax mexicanus TaxID=7994 RepID=A0A8T2MJF2_ASTMX|nr:zinc finger BED domain-containing protein 5-like [Astyanax mexicanus]